MNAALSPLQAVGFLLAAWAVIGNDSLQTLGPFLQANRGRTSRPLQALYLCAVLCSVLLLGWWRGGGDASWGRLAAYPAPACFGWVELLPPLAVLLLTQAGVPVSTSFLVLTAFTPANLPLLLRRSLLGYGLALAVGLLLYGLASFWRRRRSWARGPSPQDQANPGVVAVQPFLFDGSAEAAALPAGPLTADPVGSGAVAIAASAGPRPDGDGCASTPPCASQLDAVEASPVQLAPSGSRQALAGLALVLQWLASGWLWSQWLIQDLANIFIVLPRQLSAGAMALALVALCGGVCLLLAESGGAIQGILRRKSGLQTPESSAALSLVYGLILALLALWSPEPLSTTWVFLGLLAGRELALRLDPLASSLRAGLFDLGRDLAMAGLGLAVSLLVALLVQPMRCGA